MRHVNYENVDGWSRGEWNENGEKVLLKVHFTFDDFSSDN